MRVAGLLNCGVLAILGMFASGPLHADQTASYGSCSFVFEDRTGRSFDTIMLTASISGQRDLDRGIYDVLCDLSPNSRFQIDGYEDGSGLPITSSGFYELDMTVRGCLFQFSFGQRSGAGYSYSHNYSERCRSNGTRGGLDYVSQQTGNPGVYSVRCNDGSLGVADVSDGQVCVSGISGRVRCDRGMSVRSMSEWMCR